MVLGMLIGLGAWRTLPAVITGYLGNPGGKHEWIEAALAQGQRAGRPTFNGIILDLDGDGKAIRLLPHASRSRSRPLPLPSLSLPLPPSLSLRLPPSPSLSLPLPLPPSLSLPLSPSLFTVDGEITSRSAEITSRSGAPLRFR